MGGSQALTFLELTSVAGRELLYISHLSPQQTRGSMGLVNVSVMFITGSLVPQGTRHIVSAEFVFVM